MLTAVGSAEDVMQQSYSPELVKKAEAGDAEAQSELGMCYFRGKGVTKDYEEAVKWWTKAAERGYARAQSALGARYYWGEGVTQDRKAAVKWYTKAA